MSLQRAFRLILFYFFAFLLSFVSRQGRRSVTPRQNNAAVLLYGPWRGKKKKKMLPPVPSGGGLRNHNSAWTSSFLFLFFLGHSKGTPRRRRKNASSQVAGTREKFPTYPAIFSSGQNPACDISLPTYLVVAHRHSNE